MYSDLIVDTTVVDDYDLSNRLVGLSNPVEKAVPYKVRIYESKLPRTNGRNLDLFGLKLPVYVSKSEPNELRYTEQELDMYLL